VTFNYSSARLARDGIEWSFTALAELLAGKTPVSMYQGKFADRDRQESPGE